MQVTKEENKETGKLVANLAYQIDVKNQYLHDLEGEIQRDEYLHPSSTN